MFVLPWVGTAQQRGNKIRGYNGIIYGSYKMAVPVYLKTLHLDCKYKLLILIHSEGFNNLN
jgi:hypothetical protein